MWILPCIHSVIRTYRPTLTKGISGPWRHFLNSPFSFMSLFSHTSHPLFPSKYLETSSSLHYSSVRSIVSSPQFVVFVLLPSSFSPVCHKSPEILSNNGGTFLEECPHSNKLHPFTWLFTTTFSMDGCFSPSARRVTKDDFRISISGDNEEEKQEIHTGADCSHQNICLTSALVRIVRPGHNWWHCSWS